MKNRALWMLRMVVAVVVASGFTGTALAQSSRAPAQEPVMNAELMARLIKYIRSGKSVGSITAKLCKVLEVCDGTNTMSLKMAKSDVTDGGHYIALPLNADSKDVFFLVEHPDVIHAYLMDKTGKLRVAAISDGTGVRLITNEKAAVKFKAELALFAKEAAEQLPAK